MHCKRRVPQRDKWLGIGDLAALQLCPGKLTPGSEKWLLALVTACSAPLPYQERAASAEPNAAHPENDRKHLLSISFCLLLLLLFHYTCYSRSRVLAWKWRCSPHLEHIHQCEDRSVCQHLLCYTWKHFETHTGCLSKIPLKHRFTQFHAPGSGTSGHAVPAHLIVCGPNPGPL